MELFRIFGKIAVDNTEANKSIEDTAEVAKDAAEEVKDFGDEGEKSESKLKSAFSKIGSAAVKVGKVVATGMVAAATGIVALGKQAISEYSNYEQLVGGVETLFGDSSEKVQAYADNAYKTAGMSANEYMETVTSFSASLLQGLNGDTDKASEVANRAITDMADNANKMGTSMESIQNAYQGFAKQNYTMLDNLKLGYGGTKEEMQRLIADAAAMTDVQEELGITVDASSMSFDNIANAISVVQKNMGITGTTAKEASSTIQGSLSSMKSAWSNLLVGLADETQDFDALLQNFIDSIGTVAQNLIPRIKTVLSSVVKLINEVVPMIVELLPGLVSDILPELLNSATELINAVVGQLPTILETLINDVLPTIVTSASSIFNALVMALPQLITSILSELPALIPQLVNGIVNAVKTLISWIPFMIQPILDSLPEIVMSIVNSLLDNLPTIVLMAPKMIIALVNGMISAIPNLVGAIPRIISAVVKTFTSYKWSDVGKNIIQGFITGINGMIKDVTEKFNSIVTKIKNIFANLTLKLPDIKLPHFKIEGSFSLNPISVPHLSIDWYDKAMNNAMLLNSATIFGVNSSGQPMGGGESGQEVVAGSGTLMGMIQNAVANENSTTVYYLGKLVEILAQYFPEILSKMQKEIVLDDGTLVGKMAPKMDTKFGEISVLRARGN